MAQAIQPDKYPCAGHCARDGRRSHGFEHPRKPGDTGCHAEVTARAPGARMSANSVIGLAALERRRC